MMVRSRRNVLQRADQKIRLTFKRVFAKLRSTLTSSDRMPMLCALHVRLEDPRSTATS